MYLGLWLYKIDLYTCDIPHYKDYTKMNSDLRQRSQKFSWNVLLFHAENPALSLTFQHSESPSKDSQNLLKDLWSQFEKHLFGNRLLTCHSTIRVNKHLWMWMCSTDRHKIPQYNRKLSGWILINPLMPVSKQKTSSFSHYWYLWLQLNDVFT